MVAWSTSVGLGRPIAGAGSAVDADVRVEVVIAAFPWRR